jgi:hypothetical protein
MCDGADGEEEVIGRDFWDYSNRLTTQTTFVTVVIKTTGRYTRLGIAITETTFLNTIPWSLEYIYRHCRRMYCFLQGGRVSWVCSKYIKHTEYRHKRQNSQELSAVFYQTAKHQNRRANFNHFKIEKTLAMPASHLHEPSRQFCYRNCSYCTGKWYRTLRELQI